MTDTREIRDAREAVTEAKENIQIANIEKDISGLNDVIDGLDKKIEESSEYYDKLIEQTEKYWDSLIKGLEDYRSHWQELADIEENAKMEVMLKELGIAADDILNLSESAFESFKSTYLGVLSEMYAGDDEMIDMLLMFGGISSDSMIPFAGTVESVAESLDKFTTQTNDTAAALQSVSNVMNKVPDVDISSSISQFDALDNSVDNTTASISGGNVSKAGKSGSAVSKNTPGSQNSSGKSSDNIISSIVNVGETTAETLGESGGNGTIGKFGELSDTIAEAGSHVEEVIGGLSDLDGMNAECTITVNIETRGEVPDYASGTGISDTVSSMKLESSEYTAKHKGKAFAEGTGKYQGLPKAEKNALVSEYGQTEMTVLPNGDTIITDKPTLMDLPKDTVIYNEEQTRKIMDNKVDVSGKAHAGGTVISLEEYIRYLQQIAPNRKTKQSSSLKEQQRLEASAKSLECTIEEMKNPMHIIAHNMQEMASVGKYINDNSVSNIINNRNIQQPVTIEIGDINLTEVQDVNGLAIAIKTRLPGQMMQEYFRN